MLVYDLNCEAMRVQDGDLEERPDADDVVVHVRLCDGPVHQYKYYSWKNYFPMCCRDCNRHRKG